MNDPKKNDSESVRRDASEPRPKVEFSAYFDRDQPSSLPGSERHAARDRGQGVRSKPLGQGAVAAPTKPDAEGKAEDGRAVPEDTMPPGAGKDFKRNTK